jgi:hypothetical protein
VLKSQTFEDKIKQLQQHGMPYFYNADVEDNIKKWLQNENNATGDILGRGVLYFNQMESFRRINGLPWFIKYLPAANTGYNNFFIGKDGSSGMWPLNFAIAKKYGLKQNSLKNIRLRHLFTKTGF